MYLKTVMFVMYLIIMKEIINKLERLHLETTSNWRREWIEMYMVESPCPKCHGARLNDMVLSVKINKKNINEVTNFSILELQRFYCQTKTYQRRTRDKWLSNKRNTK